MICCKKLRSNKIMHNSHCIPIVTAPEFLRCKKLTTFFRILRYYLIFCSAPGTTIIYFTRPTISFLVLRCGLVILQFPYLYLFTTLFTKLYWFKVHGYHNALCLLFLFHFLCLCLLVWLFVSVGV